MHPKAPQTLSLGGGVRVAYPVPTSAAVTAVMKGNRSRDTRPEVLLRSALHRLGLRFRKDYRVVTATRRCRPDIVFTKQRVAVFLDGCFWHGCPAHGRTPTANAGYWQAKLHRNVERDRQADDALASAGWRVVRLWEHEALDDAVEAVVAVLGPRQSNRERERARCLHTAQARASVGRVNDTAVIPVAPRRAYRDQPRFVSLFSGCGGLDIGFRWAGFRPVWANDVDPVALDTYRAALPGHPAVAGDIASLPDRPGRGDADLVVGGPPCQGFSVAGRMDPDDPRSRHVWTFFDVVDDIRPRAFVMENVKALAINRRWDILRDDLFARADELGYDTRLYLLNAADFGVPQARERMFLIGIQRDGGLHVAPYADTATAQPTLRAALDSLPPYGQAGNDTICPARITIAKVPVLRRSPWAGMLFNGAGRPMDLDRPAPTLPASMGGNRTPIIDQEQLDRGAPPWVVDYHAHLWAGGDPWDGVPARLRRITVEEAAAIQTFPHGMQWAGPQTARYRQIGNAVPPELAYRVAIAVRSSLGLDEGTASDLGRERQLIPG